MKSAENGNTDAKQKLENCVGTLDKNAKNNDAEAQNILGWCFENGNGVPINRIYALRLYQLSSDNKNEQAKQNFEQCLEKMKLLAENGDAEIQNELGVAYANGSLFSQNWEEALKWFEKAGTLGHAAAQFNAGYCYQSENGTAQNFERALEWYLKSAEQNYSSAQYHAGECYQKGQGTEQNLEKAEEFFKKASENGIFDALVALAEMGFADAQLAVGEAYITGNHAVNSDDDQAIIWLEKSAAQGNQEAVSALCFLFTAYTKFDDDAEMFEKSFNRLSEMAEQGISEAQLAIADVYAQGRKAVSQNWKNALLWYEKAAQQGNAQEQNALANYYIKDIPEQNYALAAEWYTKAAEQGLAEAQKNLGLLYQNGQGVEKNLPEAIKWVKKAADQGDFSAAILLNSLNIQMKQEEKI